MLRYFVEDIMVLAISEEKLYDRILDWANQFDFTHNKDVVEFVAVAKMIFSRGFCRLGRKNVNIKS